MMQMMKAMSLPSQMTLVVRSARSVAGLRAHNSKKNNANVRLVSWFHNKVAFKIHIVNQLKCRERDVKAAETSASSIAAYVKLQSKQYEMNSLREERQDKMKEIE